MNRFTLLVLVSALPATAQQVPPDYGFNFVTIGDAGNDAYTGFDGFDVVSGRGSVDYEYRMAKYELRTSQLVDFFTLLGTINPDFVQFQAPLEWGAAGFFNPDGTIRFELVSPEAGDWPVSGISWRVGAMYCNWLHNDQTMSLEAISSGAYDISTFNDHGPYTDQVTRSPGAKYWLPSLDEWLKAAHYDPDKDNGSGGWWQFPNGTDEPLMPGAPGEPGAQTSYGYDPPSNEEWHVPVGAYPDVQSPYGLLDLSGGAGEWTEEWLFGSQLERVWMGSFAGKRDFVDLGVDQDVIWRYGSNRPTFTWSNVGLRLASAVPAPSVGVTMLACGGFISTRRRR